MARESNDDHKQAVASLDVLAGLRARVVLPGHGDPFDGAIADAVEVAKAAAARP
jgi:glyoxylase-like metal-dependent hydrolase (beta-lactamase superfamily II)